MKDMETVARKIGNSVGTIFPKDISPKVGEIFTILKVGEAYILKPKKEDIFKNEKAWEGFRESITAEESEWESMKLEGEEYQRKYPKQKDIIWIDFDPSKGKEIRKRRPALVVSRDEFNERTGFCLVCPITSTKRNFATYIEIKDSQKIVGEVATHQLRSIDYTTRNIEKIEQCDLLTWIEVVEVIGIFIQQEITGKVVISILEKVRLLTAFTTLVLLIIDHVEKSNHLRTLANEDTIDT